MSEPKDEYDQITHLINRGQSGNQDSAQALYKLVYSHLKNIARRQSRSGNMDTTEVVNILYLRLSKNKNFEFKNREHFFRTAAMAARQIVIDEARRKLARPETSQDFAEVSGDSQPLHLVLQIDKAIQRLERSDEDLARVFELKYFAGMSDDEVASALSMTHRTVQRKWQQARSQLQKDLPAPDRV